MSRRPNILVVLLLVATAIFASAICGGVASAAPPAKAAALTDYLASAAGTVRPATTKIGKLEATIATLTGATDGFLPKLRAVKNACDGVTAVPAGSRLTNMLVPAALRTLHLQLARSFTQASEGCDDIEYSTGVAIQSWESAIASEATDELLEALDDLQVATVQAQSLGRKLRSGGQARVAWRFSVLQYAATVGAKPPAWVKALP